VRAKGPRGLGVGVGAEIVPPSGCESKKLYDAAPSWWSETRGRQKPSLPKKRAGRVVRRIDVHSARSCFEDKRRFRLERIRGSLRPLGLVRGLIGAVESLRRRAANRIQPEAMGFTDIGKTNREIEPVVGEFVFWQEFSPKALRGAL